MYSDEELEFLLSSHKQYVDYRTVFMRPNVKTTIGLERMAELGFLLMNAVPNLIQQIRDLRDKQAVLIDGTDKVEDAAAADILPIWKAVGLCSKHLEQLICGCHADYQAGRQQAALDRLYDIFDEQMKLQNIDGLKNYFGLQMVAHVPLDILLGILTATLPMKTTLDPQRDEFRQRVAIDLMRFEARDTVDVLLAGL